MGNTRKPKVDTFDALVAEVTKEPYKLSLPDGETLVVYQPTWKQVEKAQSVEAGDTMKDQLVSLVGEEGWGQVEPFLADKPAEAVGALVRRIVEHFGYDMGEGPSPT